MEQTLHRVLVGKLSDLPEKLGKTVKIGSIEIALFRLGNGKVKAIENKCPHKGGVLAEGIVSGEYVFCPMHDWKISIDDGKVQDPDTGCVTTYQVEMVEENIYILL